jgi:hypothetical protein
MIGRAVVLALAFSTGLMGCYHLNEPAGIDQGTLTLVFTRESSGESAGESGMPAGQLEQVLVSVDSILVRVFHAGAGKTLETSKGARIPPSSDTVLVSLLVSPESGKRISVELYEMGRAIYFGIKEDVNVIKGKVTQVTIDAFSFELIGFSRDKAFVVDGENFSLFWQRVPSASAYYIQESTVPDFATLIYESSVTDTLVTLSRAEGPHYFRVAPYNPYAFGSFSETQLVYVYGPPIITSVTPAAAARGELFTIGGRSLDFPGNEVRIGESRCNIAASSPVEMIVKVPLTAVTDSLCVTGWLGSSFFAGAFVVQRIAYVTGADLARANEYKSMIESSGSYTDSSGVKIIPYTIIEQTDMSAFDLILIGDDTGDQNTWGDGVKERVDAINESGAQILGLGQGGYGYFKQVPLVMSTFLISERMARLAYVFNWSDPIYVWPESVYIPSDSLLQIYEANVPQIAVFLDPMFPVGIRGHARTPADLSYYPLLDEDEGAGLDPTRMNFLWGYTGSPSGLTKEGRVCFGNVVAILFNVNTGTLPPVAAASGSIYVR